MSLILGMVRRAGKREWRGKGTRSAANEGHGHPLVPTKRHSSLHGPTKTNVSVSGSVAVSVGMQVKSCTIRFVDFYRIRRIRTNGIASRLSRPPIVAEVNVSVSEIYLDVGFSPKWCQRKGQRCGHRPPIFFFFLAGQPPAAGSCGRRN